MSSATPCCVLNPCVSPCKACTLQRVDFFIKSLLSRLTCFLHLDIGTVFAIGVT